jgi:hypothetical protein
MKNYYFAAFEMSVPAVTMTMTRLLVKKKNYAELRA